MNLGMIGLGRMGSNMVRRLLRADHQCFVFDVHQQAARELNEVGATAARSLADLVGKLAAPRAIWLYAAVSVGAWLFAFFLVPETKGKSLEQIEACWRDGKGSRELSRGSDQRPPDHSSTLQNSPGVIHGSG